MPLKTRGYGTVALVPGFAGSIRDDMNVSMSTYRPYNTMITVAPRTPKKLE